MRIIAGILLLITILVGAYIGYCYVGIAMEIESVHAVWTPVTEDMDTYEHIKQQLAEGSFSGKRYMEEPFPDAEDMSFLTITVRMRNKGLLPQDWIELHVTPKEGDIAQLPMDRTPTLAARTRSELSTTLLVRTSVDSNRNVRVTYYVLGKQYQATYKMPGNNQ